MNRIFRSLLAMTAVWLLAAAPGADAQVPDLPQTPQLPEVPVPDVPVPEAPDFPMLDLPPEVAEALGITAPLTNAGCQQVWLVATNAAKVPALTNLALALVNGPAIEAIPELGEYVNLAIQACGSLPSPGTLSECAVDRQIDQVIETVLGLPGVSASGAVFGLTGIRIDPPNLGAAVDTLASLEDAGAPTSASATLRDQLGCEDALAAGGLPAGDLGPAPELDLPTVAGETGTPVPATVGRLDGLTPGSAGTAGSAGAAATAGGAGLDFAAAPDAASVGVGSAGGLGNQLLPTTSTGSATDWDNARTLLGFGLLGLALAGMFQREQGSRTV